MPKLLKIKPCIINGIANSMRNSEKLRLERQLDRNNNDILDRKFRSLLHKLMPKTKTIYCQNQFA